MRTVLCFGLMLFVAPAMAEIMEELDRDDPMPFVIPQNQGATINNCADPEASRLRNLAIDSDGYATTFMMQQDFVQAAYYSGQAETYRHQARQRCAQLLDKKPAGKQ